LMSEKRDFKTEKEGKMRERVKLPKERDLKSW
jgi:hypothetical protein